MAKLLWYIKKIEEIVCGYKFQVVMMTHGFTSRHHTFMLLINFPFPACSVVVLLIWHTRSLLVDNVLFCGFNETLHTLPSARPYRTHLLKWSELVSSAGCVSSPFKVMNALWHGDELRRPLLRGRKIKAWLNEKYAGICAFLQPCYETRLQLVSFLLTASCDPR